MLREAVAGHTPHDFVKVEVFLLLWLWRGAGHGAGRGTEEAAGGRVRHDVAAPAVAEALREL